VKHGNDEFRCSTSIAKGKSPTTVWYNKLRHGNSNRAGKAVSLLGRRQKNAPGRKAYFFESCDFYKVSKNKLCAPPTTSTPKNRDSGRLRGLRKLRACHVFCAPRSALVRATRSFFSPCYTPQASLHKT